MGNRYDCIVVGAGHAGAEAALAVARLGRRTLVLTLNERDVATMPCNPAIGGPAKGHIVREIDALGGEMALNIDATSMHVRTLNTGKGPAVQTLRAQADRFAYSDRMHRVLRNTPLLDVRQASVHELLNENGRIVGVMTRSGDRYVAPVVILTTGTYMNARVHMGAISESSGPRGEKTSNRLSKSISDLGFKIVRFKTGTPPRLKRDTINYDVLREMPGDPMPLGFSYLTGVIEREQALCWLGYTTKETHAIIGDNLDKAAMYSGAITGPGPRYCPSIEAKLKMFPGKERHQVFVEPEGWNVDEMYISGLSTSLPKDVQEQFVKSVKGFERAEIIRYGYAIEYDCLVPTEIEPSLMTKGVEGLFTAGQINGTTGYEEAAAQGLMAGINAVRWIDGEDPVILKRSDGYIGVLIDDLVTKGTEEPYRMMTSRAEYRLLLRHDNADSRLTPLGRRIGLVTDERYRLFERDQHELNRLKVHLESTRLGVRDDVQKVMHSIGTQSLRRGDGPTLAELIRRPEVTAEQLAVLDDEIKEAPYHILGRAEVEVKYEGYIVRQQREVDRQNNLEAKIIPSRVDYFKIPGLSREATEKLTAIRPRSIGQASRISGVSPADISVLLIYLHARGGRGRRHNGGEQKLG